MITVADAKAKTVAAKQHIRTEISKLCEQEINKACERGFSRAVIEGFTAYDADIVAWTSDMLKKYGYSTVIDNKTASLWIKW